MGWLHQQMMTGVDPRNILARIIPPDISLPDDMSEIEMWSLIANYFEAFQEPERRKKLENFNTLDDVIALLRRCDKVIVLSGAGVSNLKTASVRDKNTKFVGPDLNIEL